MTLFKNVLRNYLFVLGALEDGLHKGIEAKEYQMNYSFSCLNYHFWVLGYQMKQPFSSFIYYF